MSEYVHIGISSFGIIVSGLVSYLLHDLRDRIVRLEQLAFTNAESIAEIKGALK